MSLYGGIDLHANNSVIVLINDWTLAFFASSPKAPRSPGIHAGEG
jgi:hypothetical protein